MTRQETVIKITKITRIVGEMKSQLDLDGEIEFEALDSSWMDIGKWANEICQYMEQAPSPLLANLITNNEFTAPVVNYVQSHRQEIDSAYVKVIDCYANNMQALLSLCERQEEEVKGEYKDLIEPLANEQVATADAANEATATESDSLCCIYHLQTSQHLHPFRKAMEKGKREAIQHLSCSEVQYGTLRNDQSPLPGS